MDAIPLFGAVAEPSADDETDDRTRDTSLPRRRCARPSPRRPIVPRRRGHPAPERLHRRLPRRRLRRGRDLARTAEERHRVAQIAELTAGNFFGEMSLISGRRRTATAKARRPDAHDRDPAQGDPQAARSAPRAKALVDQAFLLRAFGGYLFPGIPEAAPRRAGRQSDGRDASARTRVVFKEGDPADAFYLIRNGMVKIVEEVGRQGGRRSPTSSPATSSARRRSSPTSRAPPRSPRSSPAS